MSQRPNVQMCKCANVPPTDLGNGFANGVFLQMRPISALCHRHSDGASSGMRAGLIAAIELQATRRQRDAILRNWQI